MNYSNNYYIVQNDEQFGPLTIIEVAQYAFNHQTKIWTNGLNNWISVKNIEEVYQNIDKAKNDLISLNQRIVKSKQSNANNTTAILSNNKDISYLGHQIASAEQRLFAFILESVILLILSGIISNIIPIESTVIIFSLISAVTYLVWSGNIGHKILGLKVVNIKDDSDMKNPIKGFFREAIKFFTLWLIIPSIWLLWDSNKQNLYDKIFDTIVINNKK
ncbi:MAG: RDD family protein [Chitinophagales bacterium]|nr:RDD family protein [Chitinophagales bacterium]